jgi:hypothetical protein
VAKKKSTPTDSFRQAISRTLKGAAREQRANVKSLTKAWQRTIAQAKKKAAQDKQRELVAQWKALRRLGLYGDKKTSPAIKNLTPARQRAIRRAFVSAQSHGTFKNGRTIRPLERVVKTTTTRWRNKKGYEYTTTSVKISYQLESHFKQLRSKKKITAGTRGVQKTKKGYIVEVESPLSKVRITKKGQLKEKTEFASGGIEITREGISGEQILRLVRQIENGKFKLPRNSAIKFDNFGTNFGKAYEYDALDLLAARVRNYEQSMPMNVFEHWLGSTELHIIHALP